MARALTIGRAAEEAGVGVETIRFYERRGLIEQPLRPRDGGYRVYGHETIERIRFIRQAQELGFSLREIDELLVLKAEPEADCAEVRVQAVAKRREVERKIARLEAIRSALDALIASCPGGGELSACTIMEALGDSRRAREASAQGAVARTAPQETVDFTVGGMHCSGCADTVAAVLKAEVGVHAVHVSSEAQTVRITFDPAATSPGRMAEAAGRAGFALAKSAA